MRDFTRCEGIADSAREDSEGADLPTVNTPVNNDAPHADSVQLMSEADTTISEWQLFA